jgi:hypothetical protein
MTEGRCPACGEPSPPQASFCPSCGAALAATDPDATVATALPPASGAIGQYADDKFGGAMDRLRGLVPRRARVDNRISGGLALVAGLATVAASFLPWIQIEIAGHSGPGSLATGLDGRDGITVLVVGVLAAVAGLLLVAGRGDAWLKLGLFVTGGVITIIGVVDIVDVQNKADALERRYGVPEGVVTASVGVGLWIVLAAGVVLLVAGLLARRAVPLGDRTATPPVSPAPAAAPPVSSPVSPG